MRKGLKKKVNGEGKTTKEKSSAEVDSNGSLISDDMSEHESESAKKDDPEDNIDSRKSDESEKSDDNDESLAEVAKAKKSKKKGTDKKKDKKKSKSKPQSDAEFEVEKVVGVKEKKGQKYYLIRWKGYKADNDTWEPEAELNCPAKIEAYLEENPQDEEEDEKEEEVVKEKAKDKSKKKSDGKSGKKRKSEVKEKKGGKAKRAKAESEDDSEEETKEYEVDKIIEVHHKKNGSREYLVRWKGYSSKEDTWEPEAHLECPELISKFNAKVEKGKSLGERELRVNPTHTEPYTLAMKSSGRRISRRGDGKQRARYYEAE